MLAAHHDQENVYTHHAGASKQQLQAKTPGARYPKTPLKIPLNDENANHGFNGKSVLRGKGNNENVLTVGKGGNGMGKTGKQAMVTPAGEYLPREIDSSRIDTTFRAPNCPGASRKQDHQRESQGDAPDPWRQGHRPGH